MRNGVVVSLHHGETFKWTTHTYMNTQVVVLREASSTPRVEVSPLVVNVEDVSFSFLRRERELLRKSFFVVSRNRVL
jgi:uncharacterized sporulation protein YeaH/YhbH (DUF444 family)